MKLQSFDVCEYLVGMTVDLDVVPDLENFSIRTDQNRCAKNSKEGSAIHRFFTPYAERFQNVVRLVREQGNLQFVLVAKGLLSLQRVG